MKVRITKKFSSENATRKFLGKDLVKEIYAKVGKDQGAIDAIDGCLDSDLIYTIVQFIEKHGGEPVASLTESPNPEILINLGPADSKIKELQKILDSKDYWYGSVSFDEEPGFVSIFPSVEY